MQKRVVIIGAGVGGLAAACLLARAGHTVTVYDKNEQPGGRNSTFTEQGFTFNYGPSWYLMPDIFERFFGLLDENITKHLTLQRLSPSYRVFFAGTLFGATDMYGDSVRDGTTFESFEPGGRARLSQYLKQAEQTYQLVGEHILYKNYDSWPQLLRSIPLRDIGKLHLLGSLHKHVTRQFKNRELQKILEYPSVFLGGSPYNVPALYSVLNHVDLNQGVFYPKGGLYAVTKALVRLAKQHGVQIICGSQVMQIDTNDGLTSGITLASGKKIAADIVVSNAGIQNTEQNLLEPAARMYSHHYWKTRTAAPSALLIYLGISGKLPQLQHHNLIFSKHWKAHLAVLFGRKAWPADPSIYVCNPSKTDPKVAPKDHENLTILVPIAAGLSYTDQTLATYADHILQTLEKTLHIDDLRARIVYQRLFCVDDFEQRYHAPAGTALGLSHTLRQTAVGRPANRHKKINNLYLVGADTAPGIGLPMCLISAELVHNRLVKLKS